MSAKNYLDLVEEIDTDDAVTELEYVEYLDENSNEPNKTGVRTFNTRDEDVFLLPHKAMLEVRGQILTVIGGDIAAGTEIALVNNGWSLFKSARYQLANQTVEDISMHLPIASTILNIVSFSDDYSRSVATNMMWFKDTSFGTAVSSEFRTGAGNPAADNNNLIPNPANDDAAAIGNSIRLAVTNIRRQQYNEGFAKRKAFAAESRQITMMLPLSTIFGFCRDYNKVFRGIKHTLILDRADQNDCIIHADGVVEGQFSITRLALWMPRVVPSLAKMMELESLLATFTKKIHFQQNRIYQTAIPNSTDYTWRVTTTPSEQLPRHLFVVFQRQARRNDQEMNNSIFDNPDVRRIFVRVNSKQYPERAIECNFAVDATRNISRPYMYLMEAMQKYQNADSGSQISIEEFRSLYPIFYFDISKHSERVVGSTADIEVTWTLGAVPGEQYNVYALVVSDRFLTIDSIKGRMTVQV